MKKIAKFSALILASIAMFVVIPNISAKVLDAADIQGITEDEDGLVSNVYIFARCALVDSYTAKDIAECAATFDTSKPIDVTVYKLSYDETANKTVVTNNYYADKAVTVESFDISELHTSVEAVTEAKENATESTEAKATYGDVTVNTTTGVMTFKESYTITFSYYDNDNDETVILAYISIDDGDKYPTLPTVPEMDNYTFNGWYYSTEEGLVEVKAGDVFTAADYYYFDVFAELEGKEVTITLDLNDGELADGLTTTIKANYGDRYSLYYALPNENQITKENYEFAGWYDGETLVEDDYVVTKDTTLTAKWEEKTYSVYLFSGAIDFSQLLTMTEEEAMALFNPIVIDSLEKGAKVELPTLEDKDDSTFAGWLTYDEELTTVLVTLDEDGKFTVNEDTALFAKWDKKEYTVSFNAGSGKDNQVDITVTNGVASDDDALATDPQYTITPTYGYTFEGWFTTKEAVEGETPVTDADLVTFGEDTILYAHYKEITFTVKAYTQDEVGGDEYSPLLDENGEEVILTYALVDYDDTTHTNKVTIPGVVGALVGFTAPADASVYTSVPVLADGSTVIELKYTRNTYTFDYIIPGESDLVSDTVAFGGTLTLKNVDEIASLNPYNTSWKNTSSETVFEMNEELIINEEFVTSEFANGSNTITLTLVKDAKESTVRFVSDGKLLSDTLNIKYGETYGELPTLTKTGYTFAGWFKATYDAEADSYALVTPETPVQIEQGYSVNVYTDSYLMAKWIAKNTTLTLDANEGVVASSSETGDYEETYYLPFATRDGYTFVKWCEFDTDANKLTDKCYEFVDETVVDGEGVTTITPKAGLYTFGDKDVTLQAVWEGNEIAVTFVYYIDNDTASEKVTVPTTQTVGSAWIGLPDYKVPNTGMHLDGNFYTDNTFAAGSEIAATVVASDKDQTYYLKWTNEYIVTYVLNGGSISEATTKTLAYYSDYDLAIPTKSEAKFIGWNTESDGTGTYYPVTRDEETGAITSTGKITNIASDITLYAIWETNQYTLTLNYNYGEVPTTEEIVKDYGTSIVLPYLTRTGYTFNGWYKTKDETGELDNLVQTCTYDVATDIYDCGNYSITATATLYAGWTAKTYTVTFDSNGGSDVSSKDVTYDATYGTLATPTKAGYKFVAWLDSEEIIVTADTVVAITEDQTLTASWVEDTFTVSFATSDLAIPFVEEVEDITVTYNGTFGELPVPEAEGYTFIGWYTDGDTLITKDSKVTNTTDITLNAKWAINQYTITYEVNGGNEVASVTKDYKTEITLPTVTGKVGYTFEKWYTDEALTTEVTLTTGSKYVVTKDTTLYAGYTTNKHTITTSAIDSEENNIAGINASYVKADGSLTSISTTKVDYNTEIVLTSDVNEKGYTFNVWYTLVDGEYVAIDENTIVVPDEDMTVYAKFTENTYNIYFSTEGVMANPAGLENKLYTSTIVLPNLERTGYTFAGWATTKGASTPNATTNVKEIVDTLNPTTDTIVLYAVWTNNSYKLTFDANEGTAAALTEAYIKYGEELSTAKLYTTTDMDTEVEWSAPTKDDNVFNGYWTAQTEGTQIIDKDGNLLTTTELSADTILYAQYNEAE